jgi:predicted acylesterase/phospholipase RssA
MRRIDDEKVVAAREIIAGRRGLSPESLCQLANGLLEMNDFGHARRVFAIALSLLRAQPDAALAAAAEIQLALATYKDPDLPLDARLKNAEAMLLHLLARPGALTPRHRQEALGLLGGIHKRRWSAYGHAADLENALRHYRAGYQMGIATDLGYTAINTAFVLDLLAAAAPALHQEASAVRARILADLAPHVGPSAFLDCTLGEACLGLRRFPEARAFMQRAAARQPDNWRLESTARQIAHIVRLQAAEDGIPFERIADAPGFAVLHDLLGGSAMAATTLFLGKVGLALSGGGFRASLYHIGVLARLADLDMLRHIEVLSCVSGGSIVGAYYYLELRHLLQTKPDGQIAREDYVTAVKNVESGFLAGVQRDIRTRMFLEPGSNWKAVASRQSTTTDRLADLYERELYSRVRDEKHGARRRYVRDLLIVPAGLPAGASFDPRCDNWRRAHKVPILVLNATTLNTGHNWQFTATFMGEPPAGGIENRIEANRRLRRMYYDDAPPPFRRIRLGRAVAASACVPGLFDPPMFDRLYEERYQARLVDGGVFDNQGASGLLEQGCEVLLVSDAMGRAGLEKLPAGDAIGVALRSVSVLQARCREQQYQLLSALQDAGLLRGFAYVHLRKDLDGDPVDWLGCPDPSTPEPRAVLTTYGIRKDVQALLADIRTDLDAFSDVEADALMLSGYRMMAQEFQAGVTGFPVSSQTAGWRFRAIEQLAASTTASPGLDLLKRSLEVASHSAFKALRLSTALKVCAAIALLPALAAVWRLRTLHVALGPLAAAALAAVFAQLLLRHVFRNPSPLWQILLALPMLLLGAPLTLLVTRVINPIYIRCGPRTRIE